MDRPLNCPNCQTENPEGARFCFNCGTDLTLVCPQCENRNPLQAKFCFNCGHALTSDATPKPEADDGPRQADPQPAMLDRFIPKGLADKLESVRHSGVMEGERRVVTILFCDVVGSTAASEQLDPEEWTEIINGAFEHMIQPVYKYEGNVARLMGDAILAFFGAPIAHEDDPQRAVLAGLDIVQGINTYRKEVSHNWEVDIDVRVGINTGLVVVGAVGSELRMEYTAMGDAINLAARMEQTAVPGSVQIAASTYQHVAPFFEFKDLGGIKVKGKQKRVQAYRVVRRKATPGRIRGIEGLDAPLVGRQREKLLLDSKILELDKGIGAIVCFIGEAGLGKSRLISELRESVSRKQWSVAGEESHDGRRLPETDSLWYETASLSYETAQPYSLFQRLIRRMIGSGPSDPPERLRDKISNLIQEFPPGKQEDVRHVFETLFGLDSQSGHAPLEGEAFKARLFVVMTALWRARISQGPAILVCDDLHWSDPASAALLKHLLPLAEQGPLLILFALRPETDSQGWGVKQTAETDFSHRYAEMRLRALSLEDSNQLVDSLLRISDMPARLRDRILEKTEGNPFFVEEVVRTLIDRGAIVRDQRGSRWQFTGDGQEIDIPGNVQVLLAARIDRLEEEVRSTLQVASVVGRSFYYRVLAAIIDRVDDLDSQLLTLWRSQFIQEAARIPELEYLFRHALTQEAAYSTILLRRRRIFHRRVAETLEALFPQQREEMAGSLALHFFRAQDFLRAQRYYTLAGDVAFRLFALLEAIDHYNQAIDCAEKADFISSDKLVHLYTQRGRAYELESRFDEAQDNYLRMILLAEERSDKALLLSSLTAQCIVRATQTPLYDPRQAKELGEEALILARELGNKPAEARVLWSLLLVEVLGGGDKQKALAYGQQSLAIARELELTEQLGYTSTNLVNVYWDLDEYEKARQANLEARAIWLAVNNMPMLADSYIINLSVNQLAGDYDAAYSSAQEALRISRLIGNMWNQILAQVYIGVIALDQGDIGRAYKDIYAGLELVEQAGLFSFKYESYRYLISLYLTVGALDQAEPLAEELSRNRDQLVSFFYSAHMGQIARLKVSQGNLARAQYFINEAYQGKDAANLSLMNAAPILLPEAMLHLAQYRPDLALSNAQQLFDRSRQAGVRHYMPEAAHLQGKALAALGEYGQARKVLREGTIVAGDIGQRRVLWQLLATLADVETKLGNSDEARTAISGAQEVAAFLANSIDDRELRESFLSQTEVQAVMDKSER